MELTKSSTDDELWDPRCPELEYHCDYSSDELSANSKAMQDLLFHPDAWPQGIHHKYSESSPMSL